jgi:hypothetical protein
MPLPHVLSAGGSNMMHTLLVAPFMIAAFFKMMVHPEQFDLSDDIG